MAESSHLPGWMLRTGVVLSGVTIFVALSIWAYLPFWELALRSDNSPLSWLSSSLLFACAVLAFQNGAQGGLPHGLSVWLTIALLGLSLDEQFTFHEYWRFHCADWTSWCAYPAPGHMDWLGDAPMALVGGVGIATCSQLYRAIEATGVRRLILASITAGVGLALGTHYGHASNVLPAWFNRFEEVFEVVSEALFLCALLEVRGNDQVQSASS